jgi:hypothetical protein
MPKKIPKPIPSKHKMISIGKIPKNETPGKFPEHTKNRLNNEKIIEKLVIQISNKEIGSEILGKAIFFKILELSINIFNPRLTISLNKPHVKIPVQI